MQHKFGEPFSIFKSRAMQKRDSRDSVCVKGKPSGAEGGLVISADFLHLVDWAQEAVQ
jgi:hypothetical protein